MYDVIIVLHPLYQVIHYDNKNNLFGYACNAISANQRISLLILQDVTKYISTKDQ